MITQENNDYYVDMFKIPLIHIKSNNWTDKKQLLNIIINSQQIKNEDYIKTSFFVENSESSEYLNKRISILFKEELKKYLNVSGLLQYQILSSWFEQQDQYMFREIHNHGLGINAICYLEYDSEIHTPTQFISPYNNLLNGGTEYFTPPNIKEGSIIFFPSIINHYTLPNKSDISRKIISWNMKVS